MATFLNEESAAASGFHIVHEPEAHRFALYRDSNADSDASGLPADRTLIGEADYSLIGDEAVDFHHTVVNPEFRGTGLSALLAHRAVTSEVVRSRKVFASCWYIEKYLSKHPDLLNQASD